MLRFSSLKIIAILASVLFAILMVVPSLMDPASRKALETRVPSWVPARAITLGLDLQGGLHVLLQIDAASLIKTQVDNLRDDVRRVLREEKIPLSGGVGALAKGVQLRIALDKDREKVMPKLRALAQPIGNLLTGGSTNTFSLSEGSEGQITFTLTEAGIIEKTRRGIEQSIEVLRRRIDGIGTKEASIQRQGSDRILVEVPGVQDSEEIKKLLIGGGVLEFRLVADAGADPNDYELLTETDSNEKIPVLKQVMVVGEDLTDAQPGFDSRYGGPVVNFRFNIRGGQRFGQVSTENVGRRFAIILDGKVISAPVINGPITGGSGQISGHFTVQQTTTLSVLMRAGAIPAKLTIVEERTVGPGLGQDSIDAGKRAAYIGTALVVVFMLVTYGLFGVFANIALAVHVVLIFALMVFLGSTLTLPGIAGIVLTIGMAVDSNVLIYERIREEFKMGRSLISALDAGFNRAFATIVDSNVTMLIAAVILFLLGSGPVKGFAITLALGILTTIFTAVTMTRLMIALWYRYQRPTHLPI